MAQQHYSRYEKARILGARALQVSYGAPVLIETEESQPILIAAEEYDAGVLPFTVRRGSNDAHRKRQAPPDSRLSR
ncbi:DNA-directed RNA polymerase subunit K [Haladaptatus pallidirubidus]|uniref:DNA-directed RNA polymerase subunit K n=1 Tax=Haladaptatus pallidirubidus TaxID=1008152 RepID=UPI0035E4B22E